MSEIGNKNRRRYHSVPVSHLLKYSKPSASSSLEKLNIELLRIYDQVCLSQHEIDLRQKVFSKFKSLIESKIDCRVEAFGSFRTKIMVEDSDIDMTVILNHTQSGKESKDDANKVLAQLHQIIYDSDTTSGPIVHVKKAKTPILKFTDRTYGYKIDISVNKEDGVQAAEFIINQLKIRPDIKYFMLILKFYLKRRKLSDTANGGLCAYAQFLMILSFFQLHPLLQGGSISVKDNLGILFLDFFQFYGMDFPYDKTAISVGENKYTPNPGSYICIEDPISPGNNVAGGCTSIGLIKDLFMYSYKIMTSAVSQQTDPNKSFVELWLRLGQKKIPDRKRMPYKK